MAFATRLGVFHTQEEVDLWRNRFFDGPYENVGDLPDNWDRAGLPSLLTHRTTSPGQSDTITVMGDKFKANRDAYSFTNYYTGANPWTKTPNNATTFDPAINKTGLECACAAFLYLIYKAGPHQDTAKANSYAVPVIAMLKDSMNGTGYASFNGKPAFNWADTARFPPKDGSFGEVNPGFAICEWLDYLVRCYEYTEDHSSWSEGEKTKFKAWIRASAIMSLHCHEVDGDNYSLNSLFVNRASQDYRVGSAVAGEQAYVDDDDLLYFGGPRHHKVERFYGNKRATMYGYIGSTGVFLNDTYLINKGKRYFEEMFMFAVWPDGTFSDNHRGMDGNPKTALGYAVLGNMYNFCEALARTGDRGSDTSFGYDFTTTRGSVTQEAYNNGKLIIISGTGVGKNDPRDCTGMGTTPKGPKLTLQYMADRATYKPPYYYLTTVPANNGDFTYLMKYKGANDAQHPCYDCQLIVAAKYFGGMNTTPLPFGLYLKQAARREYGVIHNGNSIPSSYGSIPWSSNPDSSGKKPDAWGGTQTVSTLFLYDHKINPYPFSIGDSGTGGNVSQVITFPNLPTNYVYGDGAFALNATTSAPGLTVTYRIDPNSVGKGTIDGSGNFRGTGAGLTIIWAEQSGGPGYNAATPVSRSFTIAKALLTVAIQDTSRVYNRDNPTTFSATYTGWKFTDGTSAIDSLPTFYSPTALIDSGVGSGTNTGGTFTNPYVTGKYPIVVDQLGTDNNYSFLYKYGQLAITKGTLVLNIVSELTQPITAPDFTPDITIQEAGTYNYVYDVTLNWTKISGTSVATINLTTGLIHLSGTAGDSVIQVVTLSHQNYYQITNYRRTVTATASAQTPQTISFYALEGTTYGDGPFSLNIYATGGGGTAPVTFESSDPTIALLSGANNATCTSLSSGEVNITAKQAAGGGYAAAPDVTQPFQVRQKTLTIKPVDATKVHQQQNPPFTYTVTGGYVGADTIAVITTPPTITTPADQTTSVGDYYINAIGAVATNYHFEYTPGILHITKANQSIVGFDSLPDKYLNEPPFLLPGSATSNLPLTYVLNSGPTGLTIVNGLVTMGSATGVVNVTAQQPGNNNFFSAPSIPGTFNVLPAVPLPQTITYSIGSTFAYGDQPFPITASAPGGPVTLQITDEDPKGTLSGTTAPANCTITGAGLITIQLSQAGGVNWLATSTTVTVTVNKASQLITAPTITDKYVTEPDFSVTASVNTEQPLTYFESTPALSQPVPGVNLFHIVETGDASIIVRQAGSDNYLPAELTLVFNIKSAASDPTINLLTQSGVKNIKSHRQISDNRTQYYWRFTDVPVSESSRYVIKFKQYNVPLRFKVTVDDDMSSPVINEISWNIEHTICDVTLTVAKPVNGIIEYSSVGTSSDIANVLAFEVYGII